MRRFGLIKEDSAPKGKSRSAPHARLRQCKLSVETVHWGPGFSRSAADLSISSRRGQSSLLYWLMNTKPLPDLTPDASPSPTPVATAPQPGEGMDLDLAELKKSGESLGRFQGKVEDSAEWHFLLVVAALGVPYPTLRFAALGISLLFCGGKWKYLLQKYKPEGRYHISKLRARDYIGDPLNYSEVCRARSRWGGTRQLWSLATIVVYFHAAALGYVTFELTHWQTNRISRGPLASMPPPTITPPGRPAPLADRPEANPSLRASP
jgi:hypothetical protein